jgi:hypothetical protein
MNRIRILAATLLALTLTGCSTQQVWYQPGKSFDETQRELAICRGEAARMVNPTVVPSSGNTTTVIAQAGYGNQVNQNPGAENAASVAQFNQSMAGLAAISADKARRMDIITGLMAEKGYSLVDKNSLPPGVKGVPK